MLQGKKKKMTKTTEPRCGQIWYDNFALEAGGPLEIQSIIFEKSVIVKSGDKEIEIPWEFFLKNFIAQKDIDSFN
jgi:hypothetical protein